MPPYRPLRQHVPAHRFGRTRRLPYGDRGSRREATAFLGPPPQHSPFSRGEARIGPIVVRQGKGGKVRIVPLPEFLADPLARHLEDVRALHQRNLDAGVEKALLPDALARKYPEAPKAWRWQFLFPKGRRHL